MHAQLLHEFQQLATTTASAEILMQRISQRLHESMARYNWVGFYIVDPADSNILLIGPFVGSFTPNARIPLDTGLCGAAARNGKTVVVDDVRNDPRYLSGSSMVISSQPNPAHRRPHRRRRIEINGPFPGTFTKSEQDFVEACAGIVRDHLAKLRSAR